MNVVQINNQSGAVRIPRVSPTAGIWVMWLAYGTGWTFGALLFLAVATQGKGQPFGDGWHILGYLTGIVICWVGAHFARDIYLDGQNPTSASSESHNHNAPDDWDV